MAIQKGKELSIVAISGLSWPTRSRKYLINLVKEAVEKSMAKFVIIAGHTVDGQYLEKEFKARLKEFVKEQRATAKEDKKIIFDSDWCKHTFEQEFVKEYAEHLSDFLPVLPNDVNWHIVIAERIYDRPIGAKILEKLKDMRADVRIVGERLEDGYYDREPKFPVQFPGFDTIRVIVPHRSPWFSNTITNLVQRLHNAFSPRTLSPKPSLTISGVTGTAVHLPYYDGVPNVSVPALNKILEQQATEHMIGASVIKLVANGRGTRIVNGVHNFRIAAFKEKILSIPTSLPNIQQAIMQALVPSDASLKALVHRVNVNKLVFSRRTNFKQETIKETLQELIGSKKVIFSKKSNRYGINEDLRKNAVMSLDALHKDSRTIRHTIWSCFHGAALKTLYFTALEDLPQMLAESDGGIENGDINQGNAHNYDYNGELLPGFNTVDKQEILNAYIRATICADAFKIRLERYKELAKKNPNEAVEKSLPPYHFNVGNHDAWRFYGKVGLILQQFEDKLRTVLAERIAKICRENNIAYSEEKARELVDRKVRRVGESRMTEIDGVLVGVKHPHKSRTVQKSTRVQQVVNFIWQRFDSFTDTVAKNAKGFAIAYVANFHEAAAVHVTKYGKTVLGVMTGAYLHDTEFETNLDKVVDRGPALVTAVLSPSGELLYSETEFISRISEGDYKFVTADRLSTKEVHERVLKLLKKIELDLPWR